MWKLPFLAGRLNSEHWGRGNRESQNYNKHLHYSDSIKENKSKYTSVCAESSILSDFV